MVNILSIQIPEDRDGFNDIYIIFEHMDADLGDIIKSDQKLSREHVQVKANCLLALFTALNSRQFFSVQIIRGIRYLHSVGVVHRDLKPRNILVNGDCRLKVIFLIRLYDYITFHIISTPDSRFWTV